MAATSVTLAQLMTNVRDRADMLPNNYTPSTSGMQYFVSDQSLITYINKSMFELYDLLITEYENYYTAPPIQVPTDGTTYMFPLPDGNTNYVNAITGQTFIAPAFYKLLGMDLGLASGNNAWLTVDRFDFIDRNKFVFPQLQSTFLGVFNLKYEIVGSNIMFIPTPSANQFMRWWYIPSISQLVNTSDTLDPNLCQNGWDEYIIVDAARKCATKEESWELVNSLKDDKVALIKRIQDSAMNRDAGQPACISDTRRHKYNAGTGPGGDGGYAGY